MAWIPWDADEVEQQDLRVIREDIPETMRPALEQWLADRLDSGFGNTDAETIHALQSGLRIQLLVPNGSLKTEAVVERITALGDRIMLRVVDFILGTLEERLSRVEMAKVTYLEWHLSIAASGVQVAVQDGVHRLKRRLPEGVEEATQLSVDAANAVAGAHMAKALREVQSLEPDASKVMTEAIRAVEAAAGAVVTPKDMKPSMGKIVGRMRDKQDWSLTLKRRDDGHPDHHAVVLGMLETLTFAEQHRHSGPSPSLREAQTHALLASTVVGWFATGAIVMDA